MVVREGQPPGCPFDVGSEIWAGRRLPLRWEETGWGGNRVESPPANVDDADMNPKKPMDPVQRARVLAELPRETAARAAGYRERALKLFPHVCASCAREFSGVRLKELTVHHKDHNHDNNPPDGSNWELLCLYCHDHEHEKNGMAGLGGGATMEKPGASTLFNPFGQLDGLLPSPPP